MGQVCSEQKQTFFQEQSSPVMEVLRGSTKIQLTVPYEATSLQLCEPDAVFVDHSQKHPFLALLQHLKSNKLRFKDAQFQFTGIRKKSAQLRPFIAGDIDSTKICIPDQPNLATTLLALYESKDSRKRLSELFRTLRNPYGLVVMKLFVNRYPRFLVLDDNLKQSKWEDWPFLVQKAWLKLMKLQLFDCQLFLSQFFQINCESIPLTPEIKNAVELFKHQTQDQFILLEQRPAEEKQPILQGGLYWLKTVKQSVGKTGLTVNLYHLEQAVSKQRVTIVQGDEQLLQKFGKAHICGQPELLRPLRFLVPQKYSQYFVLSVDSPQFIHIELRQLGSRLIRDFKNYSKVIFDFVGSQDNPDSFYIFSQGDELTQKQVIFSGQVKRGNYLLRVLVEHAITPSTLLFSQNAKVSVLEKHGKQQLGKAVINWLQRQRKEGKELAPGVNVRGFKIGQSREVVMASNDSLGRMQNTIKVQSEGKYWYEGKKGILLLRSIVVKLEVDSKCSCLIMLHRGQGAFPELKYEIE